MAKENMSFEARLKKLESLVSELDSDIPLDQAIFKYEEGTLLARACQKDLAEAEKKIMKIVEKGESGVAVPIEKHEFPTLF